MVATACGSANAMTPIPGFATPKARGAVHVMAGRQTLGGCDVGGDEGTDRSRAGAKERGEGLDDAFQRRHQPGQPAPLLGQIRLRSGFARFRLSLGKRGGEAGDSRLRARAAQDEPLQLPNQAAEAGGTLASSGQRMLEHREQRHRRQILRHRTGGEAQERAGLRLGEGASSGIVNNKIPALQLGGHPAGKAAIGRGERGGLAFRLQGSAHDQRNRSRFFLGARRIDPGHALESRCRQGFAVLPLFRGGGRPQRAVDHNAAFGARRWQSQRRPGLDVAPVNSEAIEQARALGPVPAATDAVDPIVLASWKRSADSVETTVDSAPVESADDTDQRWQDSVIRRAVPGLVSQVEHAATTSDLIALVTDTEGRVIWQSTPLSLRRGADRIGLVPGGVWGEPVMGTNGIGLALAADRPSVVSTSSPIASAAGAPVAGSTISAKYEPSKMWSASRSPGYCSATGPTSVIP